MEVEGLGKLGIVALIGASIVSVVWFAGKLNQEIATEHQEAVEYRAENEMRLSADEKTIEETRLHGLSTERSLRDTQDKLDVAIAILNRIDRKINGEPPR